VKIPKGAMISQFVQHLPHSGMFPMTVNLVGTGLETARVETLSLETLASPVAAATSAAAVQEVISNV